MAHVRFFMASLALGLSLAATAAAGEGGIAPSALRDIGLPGFQAMSDDAAMTVRGHGFAYTSTVAVINGTVYPGHTFSTGNSSFSFVGPIVSGHVLVFGVASASVH